MERYLEDIEVNFNMLDTHEIGTVTFSRGEDDMLILITVTDAQGASRSFIGDNEYNPSARRHGTCVYFRSEHSDVVKKIMFVQHKGTTTVITDVVSDMKELSFFFPQYFKG